jgi:phosphatidylserine decarboxylase
MSVPRPLRGPIAPQAWPASAGLLALAALALGLGLAWIGIGLFALSVANALFFRNPRRTSPPGERLVLSPADGRVAEVVAMSDPEGFVPPGHRVAIFLSVLDVHVNRVPLGGTVRRIARSGNRFLAAFRAAASLHNVQSRVDLETEDGLRVAFVQITGLIARRIVCYPRDGERLVRGEPFGLICYGSRMELYLPKEAAILVREGDRVRAGVTALAEFKP